MIPEAVCPRAGASSPLWSSHRGFPPLAEEGVIVPKPPPIELKRHFHTLSEKETDEVVDVAADLSVNFLKGKRDPEQSAKHGQEQDHERNRAQEPESR